MEEFDESKHKRDGGKFSSTEGSSDTSAEGSGKSEEAIAAISRVTAKLLQPSSHIKSRAQAEHAAEDAWFNVGSSVRKQFKDRKEFASYVGATWEANKNT
jgi:hypothetical protein